MHENDFIECAKLKYVQPINNSTIYQFSHLSIYQFHNLSIYPIYPISQFINLSIFQFLKKHCKDYANLKVLDLGCGKGAVSVKMAKELGCRCHGIDAIPEFIDFARQKAEEFEVSHLCTFETGDIRKKIKALSGYDILVLGSTGPVFGDYYTTLTTCSPGIKPNGLFIIDDGYIEDSRMFSHNLIMKKKNILKQIQKAGMEPIENNVVDQEFLKTLNAKYFSHLKKRTSELIEKYPDKKRLFRNYIKNQEKENDLLENYVTVAIMVIKKRN